MTRIKSKFTDKLNYEYFIAKRFFKGDVNNNRISKPVFVIAVTSISLSVMVMIISLCIVTGFKNEITNKVTGFGSHIRIGSFDNNQSYEENPIPRNQKFYAELKKDSRIKNMHVFATKAGIIKTNGELQGVVLKGIDNDFDNSFFKDKMAEGSFSFFSDSTKTSPLTPLLQREEKQSANSNNTQLIISKKIASLLNVKLHDNLVIYFIQQPPRVRKFVVTGIYNTGLEEFDNLYVFCNIGIIQKLNDWTANDVGGFELTVNNFDELDAVNAHVNKSTGYEFKNETIREMYPEIFHWLDLQNINVVIIIVLMLVVAGINMISTLLILILENTGTIGLLKSLGAQQMSIRKIFLYLSAYIIGVGLLFGNVAGISLCLLQKYFHIIKLPVESYYVSYVPVNFSWEIILLINAGTLLSCLAMIVLPSLLVARIDPVKTLRYE